MWALCGQLVHFISFCNIFLFLLNYQQIYELVVAKKYIFFFNYISELLLE